MSQDFPFHFKGIFIFVFLYIQTLSNKGFTHESMRYPVLPIYLVTNINLLLQLLDVIGIIKCSNNPTLFTEVLPGRLVTEGIIYINPWHGVAMLGSKYW